MTQPLRLQLMINVAPIEYGNGVITAYSQTLASTDEIRAIRERWRGTHFVRRFGEKAVLLVPLRPDSDACGAPVQVDLNASSHLVAALVRNSLIEHLFKIGRQVIRVNPISFLDTKTDLLQQARQAKPKSDLISVRPAIAIDVRVFEFDSGSPFVGAALTVRVVKSIDATCSTLLGRGLSLKGLYAGLKLPDRDTRISARFVSYGKVSRVEGGSLILEDSRQGQECIAATDAFLDASPEAMRRVFEYEFGAEAGAVRGRLFHLENKLNSGPEKFHRIQQVNTYLEGLSLELIPAIKFKFRPFVSTLPPLEACSKPIYVFDPSGVQTKTWHDGGLQEFGPYTRQTFTPSRPRICIICQDQVKGRIEQFLQKFVVLPTKLDSQGLVF